MIQPVSPILEQTDTTKRLTQRRLNPFQQMMLKWQKIHPYNAVHALTLMGPARKDALQEAVCYASTLFRVGKLVIDAKAHTYHYEPFESITIRYERAGKDAKCDLENLIREELNAPFPDGPHYPLRWTVLEDKQADQHTIIHGYHHVACDGNSIEALFDGVLRQYLGSGQGKHPERARTYSGTQQLSNPKKASALGSFVRSARQYFQFRSAHRMQEDRSGDSTTGYFFQSVSSEAVERLRKACKNLKVGLNDVFVAGTARAIAQMTPERNSHPRRHKVVVATVYSRRAARRVESAEDFGMSIGDAPILIDRPDDDMRAVVQQVVPQTSRLKGAHRVIESPWRFGFVKYIWPVLRIPQSAASYRKVFPICAGVSTVSIDERSFGQSMEQITAYVRACPPGLAMPMVLSPAIANGRLELGLTYRYSCLTADRAKQFMDLLIEALDQFAGNH